MVEAIAIRLEAIATSNKKLLVASYFLLVLSCLEELRSIGTGFVHADITQLGDIGGQQDGDLPKTQEC